MSNFLRKLALAHERHEGFYPAGTHGFPNGSVSWVNNNSGNLRLSSYQRRVYGATEGVMNFAHFPTYELGLRALQDDLRAKITGYSAHIDYRNNPTFLDYVKVYAPSDDGNSPTGYTQSLIHQLPSYGLYPSMPLTAMAALIAKDEFVGTIRKLPMFELRRLTRALKRAVGSKKRAIQRGIARLLRK